MVALDALLETLRPLSLSPSRPLYHIAEASRAVLASADHTDPGSMRTSFEYAKDALIGEAYRRSASYLLKNQAVRSRQKVEITPNIGSA